jgi:hypothetical protein
MVPTVRDADHIGSWLEVMREDNRAVVRAPPSKATDWILGFLLETRAPLPLAPMAVRSTSAGAAQLTTTGLRTARLAGPPAATKAPPGNSARHRQGGK